MRWKLGTGVPILARVMREDLSEKVRSVKRLGEVKGFLDEEHSRKQQVQWP